MSKITNKKVTIKQRIARFLIGFCMFPITLGSVFGLLFLLKDHPIIFLIIIGTLGSIGYGLSWAYDE